MLWMITKDLINEPPTEAGICNDALASSLDAVRVPKDQRDGIVADCNYEFRVCDDDANVYYEGVCLDLDDADQDTAFEPLDYYMDSDGVTYMEYRKKGEQEWKQL